MPSSRQAHPRGKSRRHELLADVADRATHILTQYGLSETKAQAAADAIVNRMVENWGGQYITIPRDVRYWRAKRWESIRREFNGFNHQELAARYRISTNSIYKIMKRK